MKKEKELNQESEPRWRAPDHWRLSEWEQDKFHETRMFMAAQIGQRNFWEKEPE